MSDHAADPERTLFDRLLSAQARIGVISKNKKNPFFGSKYADINATIDMVKPILNDEGILFMQPLSHVEGKPAITTILQNGVDSIEYTTVFPALPKPKDGKKNNPAQEMGAVITYYRRYALVSMLCLEAEDTDGNNSSQSGTPEEQSKAQQPDGAKEIPTCSICQKQMRPQSSNPNKFYCKHEAGGVTRWGKEVWKDDEKVV